VSELLPCPFCKCEVYLSSNRDWHHIKGDHDPWCPLHEVIYSSSAANDALMVMQQVWNSGVSNRTPAITQPESNEHKPSALPLGDAGKLVEALEASVKLMVEAYNAWSEEDEEMLAVINQAKLALSTHLAGTSKGDRYKCQCCGSLDVSLQVFCHNKDCDNYATEVLIPAPQGEQS
jgi:hypothetical protein